MASGVPRKTPLYYVHENGFVMPYAFNRENFKSALTYVPDPDDIFISTYPKCGTTWTQYILYLLLNKGKDLSPGENINSYIPHLEEVGKEVLNSLPKPRVIKTHLSYELVPKSMQAKYIYIARNPKDCCVSFYHHTKGFNKFYHFEDGTFDDYFEIFLEGTVDFGDYFDNLLSWVVHKNDSNVLFMLFEDMKVDVKKNIIKIGEFLGGPYHDSVNDATILDKVLEKSSFNSMKARPSCWSTEREKSSAGFIRKGKVGDWRNYFSEKQSERLDEKFRSKLKGTEAEHLWDNYDC